MIVDKNKLLVVFFPNGAGGHFIVSALALSKHSMLLSEKFILNPLDPNKMLGLFLKNITSSIELGKWQDFNMDKITDITNSAELIKLNDTISNDVYFLAAAHKQQHYKNICNIWKDLTIVNFTNAAEFTGWRYYSNLPTIKDYWEDIRGGTWPENPPLTNDELQLYPDIIKNELVAKFNNSILNYFNLNSFSIDAGFRNEFIPYTELHTDWVNYTIDYPENQQVLTWNCQDFFSKDATVDNIERLYNELGFTDFNKSAITTLYQTWISTLRALRNNRIA